MPELPEVETTCHSIIPYVLEQKIVEVVVRQYQLRWPIYANLTRVLAQQTIKEVKRRAKYILIMCTKGTLIIHLGMTGKLSIIRKNTLITKHDHVDLIFSNGNILRYTDPRRFGSIHWTSKIPSQHKLLLSLGVEPLTTEFSGMYLFNRSRKKNTPIKSFIMNSSVVVGVGNIYANEALFYAEINPTRLAHTINLKECNALVKYIKIILQKAIRKGGTTIKDFLNAEGEPGYFFRDLMVYGRKGQPCYKCNTILQSTKLNQRTAFFCPKCQH
jgi:formamidopyrimidine-DNA glycosylase